VNKSVGQKGKPCRWTDPITGLSGPFRYFLLPKEVAAGLICQGTCPSKVASGNWVLRGAELHSNRGRPLRQLVSYLSNVPSGTPLPWRYFCTEGRARFDGGKRCAFPFSLLGFEWRFWQLRRHYKHRATDRFIAFHRQNLNYSPINTFHGFGSCQAGYSWKSLMKSPPLSEQQVLQRPFFSYLSPFISGVAILPVPKQHDGDISGARFAAFQLLSLGGKIDTIDTWVAALANT